MKKKKYIQTQFINFIIEKYNKGKYKEKDNKPDEELIDDIENDDKEDNEEDEDVEDLIKEYKDLNKKYDEKRNDAIYKRR